MSNSLPCKIYLHRQSNFFGARVEHGDQTMQQAADALVVDTSPTTVGTARRRRVVERLLQHFPWETCKDDVWLGCHPLDDLSMVSTPRVLVVKVAAARAEEVLRVLMPLTRQLFVSVAVPSYGFFVEYGHSVETTNVHPRHIVVRYDSGCLSQPDLQATRAFLAKGLKDLLEPLGFIDVSDGGSSLIQFERPLINGGGKQVLEFVGAWGMIASAKSERFRDVRARSSGNPNFKLALSDVFTLLLSNGRKDVGQGWIGDDPGGMGWEEEMLWAINDVEKVFLPLLQKMQSSKDLFDWYFDPVNAKINRSSFSNWGADIESKAIAIDARLALYAARYLPDEKFLAMLDKWVQILSAVSETNHGARVSLKIAEVLRILPQTPDGPM
jgi:hypothetical protein